MWCSILMTRGALLLIWLTATWPILLETAEMVCATVARAAAPRATVVLIHGFMGDRRDLEPLRCAIANLDEFDCVSIDLPGHGDTARLDDSRAAVDAVSSALDALCGTG